MKNVPNLITCLNLFAGSLACVMALKGHYNGALVFILLAALFDFLDGFAARLLKAYSELGKQLDSLADVISFGLAPGMVVFCFLESSKTVMEWNNAIPFFAFLIPIFSAVRLAKFNIDTRQTTSFLGLPVPANGIFWASFIPAILPHIQDNAILLTTVIFGLIILFCYLMISEIPMFSLKFKSYGWKGNEFRYILILLAIISIAVFHTLGISLAIVIYVLLSLLAPRRRE